MTETIRTFDPRPVCPKCGGDRWRWEYRKFAAGPGMEVIGDPTAPRLRLTCDRCQYQFDMATKDAAG